MICEGSNNPLILQPAEGQRMFNALAKGGDIKIPFEKTFRTEGFGMLRARFFALLR